MTHVTCRLTAQNCDQLRNPTLGNRVRATFTFTYRRHAAEHNLPWVACCRRPRRRAERCDVLGSLPADWSSAFAPGADLYDVIGRRRGAASRRWTWCAGAAGRQRVRRRRAPQSTVAAVRGTPTPASFSTTSRFLSFLLILSAVYRSYVNSKLPQQWQGKAASQTHG